MIVTSFQDLKLLRKQISQPFSYCELINLPRNGPKVRCLLESKKMSEKSVFPEFKSPKMTSQSFPVSCFWSRGCTPPEVKVQVFGTSKHGEGKSLFTTCTIP